MYRQIITGAGLVAMAVLALGCGTSGNETAAAQVTKAQFIRQAKSVCNKIQRQRHRAVKAWEMDPPGGSADGFKEIIAPSFKKEAEELQAIGPPKQFEPMIEGIAKAGEEIAAKGVKGLDSPSMEAYRDEAYKFHLLRC